MQRVGERLWHARLAGYFDSHAPPPPPSFQLPSGASVDVLTAQSDRAATPHDEAELLADQDVEQLSKQLEKERLEKSQLCHVHNHSYDL